MSSFFDDASLVMIPSGYKVGTVYSVKPIDGDGDLTFTRTADTATRVGPDGLIEKVRTNQLLQSNTFSTTWVNTDTNETSGQSDPDGGTSAWKIAETVTASGATAKINQAITTGAGTFSFYAKAGEITQLLIFFGGATDGVYFNLSTGAFITYYNTGSVFSRINATSVGSGWYRYEIALNTSIISVDIYTSALNNFIHDTVVGNGFFLWRTQYESGDIATDYIATTTAAVSVGPVANLPRLDYSGGATCPKLLLERQRTNLALYSEQTDNAYWGTYQCTITANDTTSPDGYTNADKLTNTISTGSGVVYKSLSSISAGAQTMSFFIKAGTGSVGRLAFYDGTSTFSADYNLTSGTASNVTAGATTSMSDYGNGWWRCTLTATSVAGTHYLDYGIVNSVLGQYAYIYGLQFESVAAYATSYIPTLGAAVTRGADAMSKSSYACGITTEATLFADFEYQNTGSGYSTQFLIYNVSAGDYIYVTVVSNSIRAFCVSAGVMQSTIVLSSTTAGTRYKVAARFKQNDFALYVNGTLVGTDTSGTMPTFSTSGVTSYIGNDAGSSEPAGYVNQYIAFPTALSDSDLAALTA